MWHWDQGHLPYFQFDALRAISGFAVANNIKAATPPQLLAATGLNFAAPATHTPWRQYSRVLKLCLLVSERNGVAEPTLVARLLAQPGAVTCDEYLHYIACAFTEPAPALSAWRPNSPFRYPLLFSIKYLLAKAAIEVDPRATVEEIVGAYIASGSNGEEGELHFIDLVRNSANHERAAQGRDIRQARESLRVIAQISYLHIRQSRMSVTLNSVDARELFSNLTGVLGPRENDREFEIRRLAGLFAGAIGDGDISFDFAHTVLDDVQESGFQEGNKIKKTHLTIERNTKLRREFFLARPTSICDVCAIDTRQTYPWTERVIDLHHLLPLSSGTRVEAAGTTFDDLVPVCPNCHRAVHRFYDGWLNNNARADFTNGAEARNVYQEMKSEFPGIIYAD
jgi:hypothetical protein